MCPVDRLRVCGEYFVKDFANPLPSIFLFLNFIFSAKKWNFIKIVKTHKFSENCHLRAPLLILKLKQFQFIQYLNNDIYNQLNKNSIVHGKLKYKLSPRKKNAPTNFNSHYLCLPLEGM